jgi:peptide/nickel transport system substrate-binding protein
MAPHLVPTEGGSVTVALDAVPTTLNDHTVAGDTPAGRMLASAVWAQVFRIGPGLTPQLDTNVVDSAEVISLQPQTVVYQIDPRAVWSDQVPITADDFAYAWESQKGGATDIDASPDSVASTLGYRDIASLTGSNSGRTVTVVFHTPFADWPSLFDDLLPAHIAERVGWNHGFDHFDPGVLVSGGPWKVLSWQPGSSIVLGRNPRWWASPPHLDRIEVRALSGDAALTSALGRGQVQVAYPSDFDQSVMAQASSSSVLQSQAGLGTRMLQLEFNVHRAPLDTATVREGIGHAIDRAGLVQSIGQPEDHSVWEDNHHLFANGAPGYGDDAAGYEQADLTASARLLTQGGLTTDAAGTWMSHGQPVTLNIVWAADDAWSAAAGPIVAAQLVAAGFSVVATPMPSAQLYATVLPAGAFDLALVPVSSGAFPSAMGAVFSTAPAITGGAPTQDWSGFDDPKIDALFSQAVQELAPPTANLTYQQVDQALWAAMPTLPLFAEPTMLVWSSSVSGLSDDAGGLGPMWNMRLWARLAPAPTRASHAPGTAIGPVRRAS